MSTTQEITASIIEVDPGSDRIREVLELHRAEKRYLGFLPDAGFDDRAAAGTLLAALEDGRLRGYVLYDLPTDLVKIVHLCVAEEARGSGIARRLVSTLSERHPERRGIRLSCRRSYPAADLWPRLGFRPIGDRRGRSIEGHRLTVWFFDHGQPTLLDTIEDDRDLVAVDQMVFEDLVADGPHAEESRRLFDDWVEDLVELCITDLVSIESNECEEDGLRDVLVSSANEWRNLSSGATVPPDLAARVGELAPAAGERDHRHVAAAIVGGATYFISRDEDLLAAAVPVSEKFGIELLRPEQLIDRLDRDRRVGLYAPVALQGTEVQGARLDAGEQDEFTALMLNNGAGERAHRFRALLRVALADKEGHEVRAFRDARRLLGGFSRARLEAGLEVELLRVAGSDRLSRALARQLAFLQRRLAAEERLGEVRVTDPHLPVAVREALRAESFLPGEDGIWRCRVRTGVLAVAQLEQPVESPLAAAALERALWPLKLTGAGIPSYVVSIHPYWAEQLFDDVLAAQSLLHRSLALGLSREHVYYRAAAPAGIRAPSRILWYVTGADRAHAVGQIRAVSHLANVFTDRPERLHRRFSRLGIWGLEQVRGAAGASGRAMALRFLDTEVFARPLDLHQLRGLYAEAGASFHAPQSPMPVGEEIFDRIYRRSSTYAH